MLAEDSSEFINHRNIVVTAPTPRKWLTRNKPHHLQLLYCQVSVTDDVGILNDFFFFPYIKGIKLIHISILVFLQLDSEIASAMGLWIPGHCLIHSTSSHFSWKDIISFCNFVFFLKVASCNNFCLISYLFFITSIEWNILLHASNLASFTTLTHLGCK